MKVPATVPADPGGIKMSTGRAAKKARLWRCGHGAAPVNLQAFHAAFTIVTRNV
jgi:hypothetical protein